MQDLQKAEVGQAVPRRVSPGETGSFPGSSEGTASCWLSLDLHTSPFGQPWTWQTQAPISAG